MNTANTELSTSINPVKVTKSGALSAVNLHRRASLHNLPLIHLLEIPFVRKYTIVSCVLASLTLGWFSILIWPRSYVSYAELFFQVGRESIALDPTVTTGQTLLLQKSQEEDINSALKILHSRRVLEIVVDKFGEQAILSGALPSNAPEQPDNLFRRTKKSVRAVLDQGIGLTGLRDDISDRELAIMLLSGSVTVDTPRKSTVITVEATSKTPEMAQAIAQSVVDAFQVLHGQTVQTRGSREFFEAQTEIATQRLLETQEAKRRFLEERKLVSIEAKQDSMKEQMAAVQMDLLTTQRELQQALAKSQQLDSEVFRLDDVTVAGETDNTGSTWGILRQRVYELELQELKQAAIYADGNVLLESTRKELEGARKILANFQKTEQRDQSSVPNPLKQRLQEEMKLNDANIAGLKSAIEQRRTQLTDLEAEVTQLLSDAATLSQIDRSIDLFSTSLRMLQEKNEEARVLDELRLGGITSVNQFQPATFVERPIKPNKKLLMAAFVMFGIIGGLGLALLREINSGVIRWPDQAAEQLSTTVLGEVTYRSGLAKNFSIVDHQMISAEMDQTCRAVITELLLHRDRQRTLGRGVTLGVLGVEAGCGASTLSMALAAVSSDQFEVSTVLVEADRHRRTISRSFQLNGAPGLTELASGSAEAGQCLQESQRSGLMVVSSAAEKISTAESPVSSCKDFAAAIAQIQQSADLVIVDLPPSESADKLVGLVQHLDFIVVVLEAGKTVEYKAARLIGRLHDSDVHVLGTILNKSRGKLPEPISRLLNVHG